MNEKEFISFFEHNVSVTLLDGQIIDGHCCSFSWADDNPEEVASIEIKTKDGEYIDIFQNEVKTIEII